MKEKLIEIFESFKKCDIEKEFLLRENVIDKFYDGCIKGTEEDLILALEATSINEKDKKMSPQIKTFIRKEKIKCAKKYGQAVANALYNPVQAGKLEDLDDIPNKLKIMKQTGGRDPETGKKVIMKKEHKEKGENELNENFEIDFLIEKLNQDNLDESVLISGILAGVTATVLASLGFIEVQMSKKNLKKDFINELDAISNSKKPWRTVSLEQIASVIKNNGSTEDKKQLKNGLRLIDKAGKIKKGKIILTKEKERKFITGTPASDDIILADNVYGLIWKEKKDIDLSKKVNDIILDLNKIYWKILGDKPEDIERWYTKGFSAKEEQNTSKTGFPKEKDEDENLKENEIMELTENYEQKAAAAKAQYEAARERAKAGANNKNEVNKAYAQYIAFDRAAKEKNKRDSQTGRRMSSIHADEAKRIQNEKLNEDVDSEIKALKSQLDNLDKQWDRLSDSGQPTAHISSAMDEINKKIEKLQASKANENKKPTKLNEQNLEESKLPENEAEREYGVPEQKKFPLFDESHVRSAIKFFNYIDPQYEKELASAIKSKMKEFGINDVKIGDENKLSKYIKTDDSKED